MTSDRHAECVYYSISLPFTLGGGVPPLSHQESPLHQSLCFISGDPFYIRDTALTSGALPRIRNLSHQSSQSLLHINVPLHHCPLSPLTLKFLEPLKICVLRALLPSDSSALSHIRVLKAHLQLCPQSPPHISDLPYDWYSSNSMAGDKRQSRSRWRQT